MLPTSADRDDGFELSFLYDRGETQDVYAAMTGGAKSEVGRALTVMERESSGAGAKHTGQ